MWPLVGRASGDRASFTRPKAKQMHWFLPYGGFSYDGLKQNDRLVELPLRSNISAMGIGVFLWKSMALSWHIHWLVGIPRGPQVHILVGASH